MWQSSATDAAPCLNVPSQSRRSRSIISMLHERVPHTATRLPRKLYARQPLRTAQFVCRAWKAPSRCPVLLLPGFLSGFEPYGEARAELEAQGHPTSEQAPAVTQ